MSACDGHLAVDNNSYHQQQLNIWGIKRSDSVATLYIVYEYFTGFLLYPWNSGFPITDNFIVVTKKKIPFAQSVNSPSSSRDIAFISSERAGASRSE